MNSHNRSALSLCDGGGRYRGSRGSGANKQCREQPTWVKNHYRIGRFAIFLNEIVLALIWNKLSLLLVASETCKDDLVDVAFGVGALFGRGALSKSLYLLEGGGFVHPV